MAKLDETFPRGKICCKICGQEFHGVVQNHHIKKYHNMSCAEYSEKYGSRFTPEQKQYQRERNRVAVRKQQDERAQRKCYYCQKPVGFNKTKYCSRACRSKHYKKIKMETRIKDFEDMLSNL